MAYVPSHFQRYPGMERQDLTQGQLGSFKFTPVDNDPRPAPNSAHEWLKWTAQEEMRQQLQSSVRRAVAADHSRVQFGELLDSGLPRTSPSYEARASIMSPGTFSEYIRSGLDESRLKFGPAALRSVVESHSPERAGGGSDKAPSSDLHHGRTSGSASGSSDMNPVASSFVPSTGPSISHCGLNDISVSTQTMFGALGTEQEAHKHTRMLLEDALTKLQDAAAERTKMKQQIKSLVSAVNMLGGIIKHNQSRIKPAEVAATSTDSRRTMKPNPMRMEENIKPEAQSILHDILARRKAEYAEQEQESAVPMESDSAADSTIIKQVKSQTDESELFNLDLLKTSTSINSPSRSVSRKLRKHFLLDSDKEVRPITSETPIKQLDDSLLIQITPEQVRVNATQAATLGQKPSNSSVSDASLTSSSHADIAEALTNGDDNSQTPTEVKLIDTPALQLPSSFLAKYQPRSQKFIVMNAHAADERSPDTPKMEINGTKLDDTRLSRSASLDTSRQPVKQLGPPESQIIGIQSPPTQPTPMAGTSAERVGRSLPFPSTSRKLVNVVEPLKLHIKWKVTAESPIYEDEYEKTSSIGPQKLPSNQNSRFWRHPVRYIDYTEKNLFRTILIDYVPLGTTYQQVLENIYGGAIEKIELFEPIGKATNYMTARIVFHYELAASMTASYARDHQMKIKGRPVRVWQVITQTYPKNRRLEQDVFENMYTRLLLVNLENAAITEDVKDQMRALIRVKLDWLQSSIIEFSKTVDGFDLIEFTSVAAATQAMEQLRRDADFGGIEMDFEDDPCAEPYPFGGWEL